MKQRQWKKEHWAVLTVAMLTFSGLAVVVAVPHTAGPAASSSSASAGVTAATLAAASAAPAVTASPSLYSASYSTASSPSASPHPGTLQAYEPVPEGATTADPAAAYDTSSYEVILNVYETLVAYNGSDTTSMVPVLATCVPLQGPQCAQDYGAGFTGVFNATGGNYSGSNGAPTYWTFVVDPAARFYDPGTGANWSVYPSDVMFSIARTLAWSTYPYVAKTSGWILAQSLLPYGNSSWDSALHFPFNNTPSEVLGSMLVNDSAYCPATAMDGVHGNGCITFVANGTDQIWPEFRQFVADNLGGSVVPCGWFTSQSAGIPGWSGTSASNGDGSCPLPDGGTNTTTTSWTNYLASLDPTSWDSFIHDMDAWPASQPNVQWNMVGSGPYYAHVNPGINYDLAANPAYAEPSGCSGVNLAAVYTGYCNPAPGGYIPNVDVTWESASEGDTVGIANIEAGTADFAGITTAETTTLLGLVASGIWQYVLFPTLSTAFTPINLGVSYGNYNTTFAGTPLHPNPIPPLAFSDIGLRNFYINSYPYTTIENTINTVAGIQYAFNAGGPIPYGMGDYYPSNVSWPYLRGDPTQPATTVGSAAWWWAQLTDPSSPYYNATVATKCTPANPCTWPIGWYNGEPSFQVLVNDWTSEIYTISGHALAPWALPLSFTEFLSTLSSAYSNPLVSAAGFGWAPDYPDPTDYVAPMAAPAGSYTSPNAFSNQLFQPQYEDNATCGHNGTSNLSNAYQNLTYWANVAKDPGNFALNSSCQGVAYRVASYWMNVAGGMPHSAERVLYYNLIEQITNALGMYVYNGQTNQLIGFAPWIDPSSVNQNPVIGGGGVLVWYQVRYQSLYGVTMQESGLPAGTSWTATVGPNTNSSTTNSITFPALPNGTYNFSVGFQPGYTASASNGTVVISGSSATISMTYAPFSGSTSEVTFAETGLVTNTTWSLVVQGYGSLSTNASTMTFVLPMPATYSYQAQSVVGYTAPAGGTVVVTSSSASVTVPYVGFFYSTYTLTFEQTGLPSGTSWSVKVGPPATAYEIASTTSSLVFTEQNGTYSFTVSTSSAYAASITHGTVEVNGSVVTVLLQFSPTFGVTFTETGLTAGATWTVYFGGEQLNATAPGSISFHVTNGSWTFSTSSAGMNATPGGGSVKVSGQAKTVAITFTSAAAPPAASPAWTYLSTLAYVLVGVLAALAVIGFALAVVLRGRRPPTAPPPQSWAEEQGRGSKEAGGATPPPESGEGPPKT